MDHMVNIGKSNYNTCNTFKKYYNFEGNHCISKLEEKILNTLQVFTLCFLIISAN
jgi:hypothetical protein